MSPLLDRVIVDPNVCLGQPRVKGTRIMVWLILNYLARGDRVEDILALYPALTREKIKTCFAYAAEATYERVVSIDVSRDHACPLPLDQCRAV